MTYGRPSMISSKRPLNYVLGSNLLHGSTGLMFYYRYLELHEILGDILAEFYENPPLDASGAPPKVNGKDPKTSAIQAFVFVHKISTGDFQPLLKYDGALLSWKAQLPDWLDPRHHGIRRDWPSNDMRRAETQPVPHAVAPPMLKKQAVILHAR